MAILLQGITFDGPYFEPCYLDDRSGVFVVLCEPTINGHNVLYIEETTKIRSRIEQHEFRDSWLLNCKGKLYYAACYCDQNKRTKTENELIEYYNPICQGIRQWNLDSQESIIKKSPGSNHPGAIILLLNFPAKTVLFADI